MKFAADCMLGSLAKWLLILGHDVSYDRAIDDGDLVSKARREGRTILTRDRRLLKRRGAGNHVLIASDDLKQQLRQVLTERQLTVRQDRLFQRCLKCNEPTRAATRDTVRGLVPIYVYRTQSRFRRCPKCEQIYWRATHVNRMLDTLRTRLTPDPRRDYHSGSGKRR